MALQGDLASQTKVQRECASSMFRLREWTIGGRATNVFIVDCKWGLIRIVRRPS
jgi:hypothetical protein